jgi:hypothetical protein
MLAGGKPTECSRCYSIEEVGVKSFRQKSNDQFAKHLQEILKTNDDGSLTDPKLRYWDFRFSNLCNFKCRSCDLTFSSSWYEEQKRLPTWDNKPRLLDFGNNRKAIFGELLDRIDDVEDIYFAGGEPLILPEHISILKELIRRKNTKVVLRYNTNFSTLSYKGESIVELWRHFENVIVGASLDGSHERAEVLRNGTKWDVIEKNRELLKNEAPHVHFHVGATISAMNVWHFPDFYLDWVKKGWSKPESLFANVLDYPRIMSITVLPEIFKREAARKWFRMGEVLKLNHRAGDVDQIIDPVIRTMFSKDNSHRLPELYERMVFLDGTRGESFTKSFPELNFLEFYKSAPVELA